ncbi:hypothetical protein BHM03_00031830 [Ensete ventricosum]|nr:hypothetical protein BHM03_00031830 [Ensete ventricosum]
MTTGSCCYGRGLEMAAPDKRRRGVGASDNSRGCGRGGRDWERWATDGVEKQGRKMTVEKEAGCRGGNKDGNNRGGGCWRWKRRDRAWKERLGNDRGKEERKGRQYRREMACGWLQREGVDRANGRQADVRDGRGDSDYNGREGGKSIGVELTVQAEVMERLEKEEELLSVKAREQSKFTTSIGC